MDCASMGKPPKRFRSQTIESLRFSIHDFKNGEEKGADSIRSLILKAEWMQMAAFAFIHGNKNRTASGLSVILGSFKRVVQVLVLDSAAKMEEDLFRLV